MNLSHEIGANLSGELFSRRARRASERSRSRRCSIENCLPAAEIR